MTAAGMSTPNAGGSQSARTGKESFANKLYGAMRNQTDVGDSIASNELDYNTPQVPAACRNRLYSLFGEIEKEFDTLFAHNLALHAKVEALTEKLSEAGALDKAADILKDCDEVLPGSSIKHKRQLISTTQVGAKLKSALGPGRLVQTFKGDGSRTRYVRTYTDHLDGVWHVDCANRGSDQFVASASADGTSRIYSLGNSNKVIAKYSGHKGISSVNCVRWRTTDGGTTAYVDENNQCQLLTASGDQSAHIWQCSLDTEEQMIEEPLLRLTGHTGVVIAADWMANNMQIVTASWDRTANIYDAERGEILNRLSGHDQELTHCHTHPVNQLIVTSSNDSTFRLWDFRDAIHSVAVFQGHNDCVNSAVLTSNDKVISASDDRTVKVWDLKNMRAALTTIRLDSPVNRISVSKSGVLAIPHDNRHIRLYDLNGNRLARLPRTNRRCRRRMVCCAAWSENDATESNANLVTCAFDKTVIAWNIKLSALTSESIQATPRKND